MVQSSSNDESDGISVISESELKAQDDDTENESVQTAVSRDDQSDMKTGQYLFPPTPPATPKQELKMISQVQQVNHVNQRIDCTKVFWALAGMVLLISVFYSLRMEIQNNERRIQMLEEEITTLKAAFEEMTRNEAREPPAIKTIWLGSEQVDDAVTSNNGLPEFCNSLDRNDLFYEVNQYDCDKKRKKLEIKATSHDNLRVKKTYDDFISDTMKSLNDEIQEIKRKRPKKEGNSISGEWLDKRKSGRQEARNKENEDTGNWYLRRKKRREELRK